MVILEEEVGETYDKKFPAACPSAQNPFPDSFGINPRSESPPP